MTIPPGAYGTLPTLEKSYTKHIWGSAYFRKQLVDHRTPYSPDSRTSQKDADVLAEQMKAHYEANEGKDEWQFGTATLTKLFSPDAWPRFHGYDKDDVPIWALYEDVVGQDASVKPRRMNWSQLPDVLFKEMSEAIRYSLDAGQHRNLRDEIEKAREHRFRQSPCKEKEVCAMTILDIRIAVDALKRQKTQEDGATGSGAEKPKGAEVPETRRAIVTQPAKPPQQCSDIYRTNASTGTGDKAPVARMSTTVANDPSELAQGVSIVDETLDPAPWACTAMHASASSSKVFSKPLGQLPQPSSTTGQNIAFEPRHPIIQSARNTIDLAVDDAKDEVESPIFVPETDLHPGGLSCLDALGDERPSDFVTGEALFAATRPVPPVDNEFGSMMSKTPAHPSSQRKSEIQVQSSRELGKEPEKELAGPMEPHVEAGSEADPGSQSSGTSSSVTETACISAIAESAKTNGRTRRPVSYVIESLPDEEMLDPSFDDGAHDTDVPEDSDESESDSGSTEGRQPLKSDDDQQSENYDDDTAKESASDDTGNDGDEDGWKDEDAGGSGPVSADDDADDEDEEDEGENVEGEDRPVELEQPARDDNDIVVSDDNIQRARQQKVSSRSTASLQKHSEEPHLATDDFEHAPLDQSGPSIPRQLSQKARGKQRANQIVEEANQRATEEAESDRVATRTSSFRVDDEGDNTTANCASPQRSQQSREQRHSHDLDSEQRPSQLPESRQVARGSAQVPGALGTEQARTTQPQALTRVRQKTTAVELAKLADQLEGSSIVDNEDFAPPAWLTRDVDRLQAMDEDDLNDLEQLSKVSKLEFRATKQEMQATKFELQVQIAQKRKKKAAENLRRQAEFQQRHRMDALARVGLSVPGTDAEGQTEAQQQGGAIDDGSPADFVNAHTANKRKRAESQGSASASRPHKAAKGA